MKANPARSRFHAALVLLAILVGLGADTASWRQAGPGYEWKFPRDMYAHPEFRAEWWYVTGNLHAAADTTDELAFQLTFFRIGVQPAPVDSTGSVWRTADLIMAHAAVTDPASEAHTFSEVFWRTTPFLGGFGAVGDSNLAWCAAPPGTPGRWRLGYQSGELHLQARDDKRDLAYDLRCRPSQAPVLHGRGGFSPKAADGSVGSLYFSQPRLAVTGTVWRDGQPLAVAGQGWLDREMFSNTLGTEQKGWDWAALQLDDGREIMLYRLLDQAGRTDFALGTLVETDGTSTPLPGSDWRLTARKFWTSPDTGARYPVQWDLVVPRANLELRLEAVLPDQENLSSRTGIHYWEGAVRVRSPGAGGPNGRGFVEMTGYGKDSRPPI